MQLSLFGIVTQLVQMQLGLFGIVTQLVQMQLSLVGIGTQLVQMQLGLFGDRHTTGADAAQLVWYPHTTVGLARTVYIHRI